MLLQYHMNRVIEVIYEPVREKSNNLGVPPGPTQSSQKGRSLKLCIKEEEELYYPCSENKGADQL